LVFLDHHSIKMSFLENAFRKFQIDLTSQKMMLLD